RADHDEVYGLPARIAKNLLGGVAAGSDHAHRNVGSRPAAAAARSSVTSSSLAANTWTRCPRAPTPRAYWIATPSAASALSEKSVATRICCTGRMMVALIITSVPRVPRRCLAPGIQEDRGIASSLPGPTPLAILISGKIR